MGSQWVHYLHIAISLATLNEWTVLLESYIGIRLLRTSVQSKMFVREQGGSAWQQVAALEHFAVKVPAHRIT